MVRQALECGAQTLWLVGPEFAKAAPQSDETGVEVRTFEDVEAARRALGEQKPTGRLILIKGSNSTRLHQLPELL